MKKRIVLLTMALLMVLPMNAFALEVPTETVVQNLNGSQQVVKTYTIAPGDDPQELIEEPFELEGYLYTFADIVKVENHVEESKQHTETVTVETSKKDLSVILEQLAPHWNTMMACTPALCRWTIPAFIRKLPAMQVEAPPYRRQRRLALWIATICPMSPRPPSKTASR